MTTYSDRDAGRTGTGTMAGRQAATERQPRMYAARDEAVTRRRDRVRWGPIWAGLVVALSVYLLLQLILVASGAVDLADPTTGDAVWSGLAAVVGFFIGGVVVGATSLWRGIDDGALHGVVMWAVGLVALLVMAAAGSGIALGSIDTTSFFDDIQSQTATDPAQANDDAQDAAWRALGVIGAALVASAAGGAAGAKLWPRVDVIDLRSGRTLDDEEDEDEMDGDRPGDRSRQSF